jgi:hypothetical protein
MWLLRVLNVARGFVLLDIDESAGLEADGENPPEMS